MDQFRATHAEELARTRGVDRVLDFRVLQLPNTLPSLKKWDTQYRDKGLTVIGVHTPELDFERDLDQLRRKVAGLWIKYPVVTDQDYLTWKAYGVEAWPTMFLLDQQARVRWTHVGEGPTTMTKLKKCLRIC